ncbi:MAG: diaminopimelate epimerase [Propionibacteriaceae bacterium]|nr:diaminopimelate epimerase [Propionibacteriaceae bacterium]
MREIKFAKGHATLNDFVLCIDPDDQLHLSDAEVSKICHRRAGIGADGVLRAVKARHISDWGGDQDVWFMDIRNSDGSLAETCGNGLRLFVLHLVEEGLAAGSEVKVGTRAGLSTGVLRDDGLIEVSMGDAVIGEVSYQICSGHRLLSHGVDVGNPHLVSFLPDDVVLDSLDLSTEPILESKEQFPHGVNHEFVEVVGPARLRMRVYERGAGETMSCGSGVVASACAAQTLVWPSQPEVIVEVPGGELTVKFGQEITLLGSAEIVAHGSWRLPADE